MKVIGDKQYPTIWSELFIRFKSVEALDEEPTVSVICITEWLEEYHNLPADTSDGNLVNEQLKKGIELINYLPTVSARIHALHAGRRTFVSTWASQKKASYPGEKLSEAARDRMILVESEYTEYQSELIRFDTMERWCIDMQYALKEALAELNIRMKRIISEQPLPFTSN